MARILIVDDEIGIRELLQEILQDHLHEVKTAENVVEAKSLMLSFSPQIVLLDVWLKQANGIDLLKEWHAQSQVTMPIILMSGHANIETWTVASKFGAHCLIEKPISTKVLLNTLKPAVAIALKQKPPLPTKFFAPIPYSAPPAVIMAQPIPEIEKIPHPIFDKNYRDAREAFERAYFSHHIRMRHGSMTAISEATGVERTHLYRVLKSLGLNDLKSRHCLSKPGAENTNEVESSNA